MVKKKYKCDNCGFEFESGRDAVICPYCSKTSITLQMNDDDALVDVDEFVK